MKLRRIILSIFVVFTTVCSTPSFSRAEVPIKVEVTKTGWGGPLFPDKDLNGSTDLSSNSCAKKVYDKLNAVLSSLEPNTPVTRFEEIKGYFQLKIDNPKGGTIGKIAIYAHEPSIGSSLGTNGDPFGCKPILNNDSDDRTCYSQNLPAPSDSAGCEKFTNQITKDSLYLAIYNYMGEHRHHFKVNSTTLQKGGAVYPTGGKTGDGDPAHATQSNN